MINNIAEYGTGLTVVTNEDGFVVSWPDGSFSKHDTKGERVLNPYELGAKVKVGDYIECAPNEDYFVVSSIDSGYYSEQKFEVGKATKWLVIKCDDDTIEAISAEKVGTLWLTGYTGYRNSVYILNKIAQACLNTTYMYGWRSFGWEGTKDRLKMPDMAGFKVEAPYIDNNYEKDVEYIKALGIELPTPNGAWLGSRQLSSASGKYYFGVRFFEANGKVDHECLNKAYIAGSIDSHSSGHDVFSVMTFCPDIGVVYGDGSKENPYRFEI